MAEYTDRKRYMKDKYNCDLLMVEGVELVPLYQIIDKLEKSVLLDRVKQAREEIERNAYPIVHGVNNHDMGMTLNGIFQVLDKLIAEVEGKE